MPEPSAPTNPAEPAETDGDGGSETEEEEEENEEAGEYTTTWTAEDGGATDTVTIPPGWAPGWGDEGPYGSYTPFSLRPTQSIQVPSGDDSDEDGNGNKIVTSEGPGGGLLDVLQRISQSASSSGGGGAGPTTTEGNGPSSTVSDDAAPTMGLEVGGMVAVAIGVVAVL